MRVYVNVSPVRGAWGGGNQWTKAFISCLVRSGHVIDMDAQVVVIGSLDSDGNHPSAEALVDHVMNRPNRPKVIIRVNENDARRGTGHVDDRLLRLSEKVDGTVFVSSWLKSYFEAKGWVCPSSTTIWNGVDRTVFQSMGWADKLCNQRVAKRHSQRTNIVTHHWSDNRMKGADVYEAIDAFVGRNAEAFTFTYIGRTQSTFQHSQLVPPAPADSLGRLLGRYDVYVSGSRWDPGPNHITESISCGLPTYVHKDGGGCVEFAGRDHAYGDWDELERLLLTRSFKPNSTSLSSWEECTQRYVGYIQEICNT
jgi:hypothetical protein